MCTEFLILHCGGAEIVGASSETEAVSIVNTKTGHTCATCEGHKRADGTADLTPMGRLLFTFMRVEALIKSADTDEDENYDLEHDGNGNSEPPGM